MPRKKKERVVVTGEAPPLSKIEFSAIEDPKTFNIEDLMPSYYEGPAAEDFKGFDLNFQWRRFVDGTVMSSKTVIRRDAYGYYIHKHKRSLPKVFGLALTCREFEEKIRGTEGENFLLSLLQESSDPSSFLYAVVDNKIERLKPYHAGLVFLSTASALKAQDGGLVPTSLLLEIGFKTVDGVYTIQCEVPVPGKK